VLTILKLALLMPAKIDAKMRRYLLSKSLARAYGEHCERLCSHVDYP
jgi:hypothetical protein